MWGEAGYKKKGRGERGLEVRAEFIEERGGGKNGEGGTL